MNLKTIKLTEIVANPNQPRKHFDEQALQELADSIKSDGLQEPILVRPKGDKYEIVQGERRYRAHKLAGLETIQAKVKEVDDEDAFHLAVIENIQREQLTPIEEARAFQKYVEMGYKHEDIAKKVSKSRTYVTTKLRLLKLIPRIQDWIADNKLSDGHAKQLLRMESIINRFWEGKPVYSGSHFNFFQERFVDSFWERLDNGEKVSVIDVKEWGDRWYYGMINSIILHYRGKGDTIVNENRGFSLTAEMDCRLWNLHISKIREEDIDFANAQDLDNLKDEFDEGLRPWMIDKFWDDLKIELFSPGANPSEKWDDPLKDKTLEDHTREIRKNLEKFHATLYLFAKMFHDFADEHGKSRLSNLELAERFCEGNEESIYSIEELEGMFEEVMEMEFSEELLDSLAEKINKSVT
ncbi:ParB/RepB/Spo0J family partition protein [Bacillus thermophilus]|uniref:ParB/RepB/Spo0J family partition protein n=1 Tax=Siminovitchia thermophila TaxID=1245522 RepID=A0ABS2RDE5_9BACI|nr:ParB/RepB/Spo0J family partition protein [Siminovitchia thermophila]MBM7717682.1 ParB/RepB/Spo0J family partition protein [Siminovitchia thermophila]ONK24363.1 hypothetical protein BLX87_05470 [Bacillus sp. VT-16-64]